MSLRDFGFWNLPASVNYSPSPQISAMVWLEGRSGRQAPFRKDAFRRDRKASGIGLMLQPGNLS